MFTGLIQDLGVVEAIALRTSGARLSIRCPGTDEPLSQGESIAVNGVCLTAIPHEPGSFDADLSPETLASTNLQTLSTGDAVNLERAMRMTDRLGGHLVQGHVDGVGALLDTRMEGDFAVYRWEFPREFSALVVSKGSIAVDGISLTIVEPDDRSFAAALIPETLQKTNLRYARVGDKVNLEFDLMAKFAQRLMQPYLPKSRAT